MPSPGAMGWSRRIRPIASDNKKGSLSGWGFPKLMVKLPCGSASMRRTFFPALARPMPRLAQVVVLPTLCEASHNVGNGKQVIMES